MKYFLLMMFILSSCGSDPVPKKQVKAKKKTELQRVLEEEPGSAVDEPE